MYSLFVCLLREFSRGFQLSVMGVNFFWTRDDGFRGIKSCLQLESDLARFPLEILDRKSILSHRHVCSGRLVLSCGVWLGLFSAYSYWLASLCKLDNHTFYFVTKKRSAASIYFVHSPEVGWQHSRQCRVWSHVRVHIGVNPHQRSFGAAACYFHLF